MDVRRLSALGGVCAPIVFTVVVATLGALTPGYSHTTDVISLLGATHAPYGIVQNLTFVVSGLLLVGFAVGLHRGVSDGLGSRAGPGLLTFAGVGTAGAGVFPMVGGAKASAVDWTASTSVLHQLSSVVFLVGTPAGMYALSRRLARDPDWDGYDRYSRAGSIVPLGLVLLYSATGADGIGLFPDGALQRLYVALVGIWVEVTAVRLYRLA